jgi:hypothetical protein
MMPSLTKKPGKTTLFLESGFTLPGILVKSVSLIIVAIPTCLTNFLQPQTTIYITSRVGLFVKWVYPTFKKVLAEVKKRVGLG